MGGGCLWSIVPLLILIPLYVVIREPITYILHETAEVLVNGESVSVAQLLTDAVKSANPAAFESIGEYYHQLVAAANLTPEIAGSIEGVKDVVRTGWR